MKINVCSETEILHVRGEGVYTAFLDCVELLKEKKDIEIHINNEGMGDVMHSYTYKLHFFWRGSKYKGRSVFTVHVIPDSVKGSIPAWKFLMPFLSGILKRYTLMLMFA